MFSPWNSPPGRPGQPLDSPVCGVPSDEPTFAAGCPGLHLELRPRANRAYVRAGLKQSTQELSVMLTGPDRNDHFHRNLDRPFRRSRGGVSPSKITPRRSRPGGRLAEATARRKGRQRAPLDRGNRLRRAVVNDDDLDGVPASRLVRQQLAEGRPQAVPSTVGRDDYADIHAD